MDTEFIVEGKKQAIQTAKNSDDPMVKVGAAIGSETLASPHFYEQSPFICANTNRFATRDIKQMFEVLQCRDFLRQNIVHAEFTALENWRYKFPGANPTHLFVTHQPCLTCVNQMLFVGIKNFFIGPGKTTQGSAYKEMVERIICNSGGQINRWEYE